MDLPGLRDILVKYFSDSELRDAHGLTLLTFGSN
jgi:hypothetical protein